jgi:uncharacterized membrane protein YgcG
MFGESSRAAAVAARLVWLGLSIPSVSEAEVGLAGPSDEVEARINALQPGDELILSNGAPNTIERNVTWNCGDHGIQSAADAVIRNDIILGARADGIAMQPHQSGSPSQLVVVYNTVLNASGDAVSLRGISGSVVVANNALYAEDGWAFFVNGGTVGLLFSGNAAIGGVSEGALAMLSGEIDVDFLSASFDGAPPMSVFPATGGALVSSGLAAHVVADDFNGTEREAVPDVGAYRFSADGNPGWALAETMKTSPAIDDPGAAGTGGSITGSGGSAGSGGASSAEPSAGSSGCGVASPSEAGLQLAVWLVCALLGRRRRVAAG